MLLRVNSNLRKTIQNLKPEHNEFIDYEIFRDVYQQMVVTKIINAVKEPT